MYPYKNGEQIDVLI